LGLVFVSEPLTPGNAASEIDRAVSSIFSERRTRRQRLRDLVRERHLRYLPVAVHSGSAWAFRLAGVEV
jgi:gamma-glutamyl:cysteine ligase YbdK (ATP-grasp superfamily)